MAGRSARREYERQRRTHEEQIEQRWGRFAGVVKRIADEPQPVTAWKKGSEGEQRLAERLGRDLAGQALLLHDRRAPGRRSNLDHLIIGPSGVWVVDAKRYSGKVERRDVGGFFKTDVRLFVKGRDRSKLALAMPAQVEVVSRAVDDPSIPVTPALCFIDTEWPLFARPFQVEGVWVLWARRLAKLVLAPTRLDRAQIEELAARLTERLPPA